MEHPDFFAPKFPLQLVTLNYELERLAAERSWGYQGGEEH